MRNSLAASLEREFPDWLKKEKAFTIPGGETYVSSGSSPQIYLVYYRSSSFDAFFSEIAWSRQGKWPAYPSSTAEIDSYDSMPEARFRIEQFWVAPPYTMQAWCLRNPAGLRQLDPVADSRREELVADVDINLVAKQYCGKIRECIIPIVERISRCS